MFIAPCRCAPTHVTFDRVGPGCPDPRCLWCFRDDPEFEVEYQGHVCLWRRVLVPVVRFTGSVMAVVPLSYEWDWHLVDTWLTTDLQ